jgi:hypothetical protein
MSVVNMHKGMRFGMGVDSQTETVCGEALKFSGTTDAQAGQRVTSSFKKIDSQESLMESMKLSVSASLSYGLASVDAKMSFASEHAVNDYTVYLLLQASVINPARHMVAPELTDEALAVFKRGPEEFRQTYGDTYIDEIYGGGEFFGLFMFHTHDETTKTSISADLDMSIGTALSGGSISASFQSTVQKKSRRASTDIKTIMTGGAGLQNPKNIDELVALYAAFNAEVLRHPVDFRVGLKEFKYLPLPPGRTWAEQLVRRETIESCGRNVVEGIKQRSKLEYILRYPAEFEKFDEVALRAKLKEVNAVLPKWASRARECALRVH